VNQSWFNWKSILYATLAVLGVLYLLDVFTAPDKVLEDVLVFDEGNRVVLQVKFAVGVRYENHFPTGRTDFVQIKLREVSFGGSKKNEYIGGESILPGFVEKVPILDVAYEPNVPGGPFLSLRFKEPVTVQVTEDAGLRAINVSMPARRSLVM